MRYLSITKSGIWQFRFQLPIHQRKFFDDRREIKRSLHTSCKKHATVLALELETRIRKTIMASGISNEIGIPNIEIHKASSKNIRKTEIGITALDALERFCQYKSSHVSAKEKGMLKAKCTIVIQLLDKTLLKSIRRIDAEGVASLLRTYPTNMKKHKQFLGLSGRQAIKLNESLKMPTLSEESVKGYCQKMSGFFEWCCLNELTDINPFKAIRFKKERRDSEAKHAYSIEQLKLIFSSDIYTKKEFKHPHYYWLPLLAYFTGARLNELCQLYKADIYQQNDIWVIRIDDKFQDQKLKTLASRRIIPLHNKLIALGFVTFAMQVNHDRVFPELKFSRDGFGSAPSKWFGRFKTKLGFGRGYDFHSFRHTVATQFKRQQVSHITAGEILGHTQNNITYDRYGKGLDTAQMQEVINLIDGSVLSNFLKFDYFFMDDK